MKKYKLIVVILSCLLSSNGAYGFDGNREGFVIGLGIGAGVVNYTGVESGNEFVPMISGNLSYGFSDNFQLGIGKKALMGFKYNNETTYQELGGIVADLFFDDYYITFGTGISGAVNDFSFSLSNVSMGKASYVGVGYEFSDNFYIEYVLGEATFDNTSSTVSTPDKETFFGVLLTTFIY